uniref:AP-3 complex subunit beta n=1 Tax=Strigamia maritima TaxID=126957 RepID=T1J818_STRMM
MMSNNGSYANERPPSAGENEFASDPASGSFFASDFKKHEDLKTMLDSNKDGLKLEAMKRIIGMVAKGKDASDLFPAVVKNVVSKNIEVKKLVYVYLVRYGEEQQDLALLSISTFQRALKDPNQLIRASALRVLSSIRVPVIVPIMMLAIKDSVNDMSPYVRKTAAHAIPKLYNLDPEQKDQLIEVIEKLLADKTTLVVGSAVMSFEEVCPERIDLVHKNYRKLCNLLVDVEEWGQVVIMNMLTRYARTQFVDPNKEAGDEVGEQPFYDDEDDERMNSSHSSKHHVMDSDHRLLLRNTKPLLQSRNASVVMAVAQLYHHLAPKSEVILVAKALVRLLRNHREVQSVVLSNIASMSTIRKGMFEPYLKSFFVRTSDPTHIKLLKLEILTNLATETNISIILREFQTYVSNSDKEFVAATIQAIGRCASTISEVTDPCLSGLVSLMSNREETVVAESVVVIKKLLQMQPSEHKEIITNMARLVDTITVPMARASILWLLGEYSDRVVPRIAPDVLRKMAKTFIHEEDIVKLQILNLATKLFLTNSKQTKLLVQYVFNLAKYDVNYDIRDRARFLRQFIFPAGDKENHLSKYAKKIFLSSKPAPVLESMFKDRDQYQLGSLSHYINAKAIGYNDLPDFPEVAPDTNVRNVEMQIPWTEARVAKKKKRSFYSESGSSPNDSSSDSDSSSDESDSDSEKSSSSSSESESESEKEEMKKKKKKKKIADKEVAKKSSSEDSFDDDESSSESEDEDEDEDSSGSAGEEKVQPAPKPKANNIHLLLELDDIAMPLQPGMTTFAHSSTLLTPMLSSVNAKTPLNPLFSPIYTPLHIPMKKYDLLNSIVGGGLAATYRFTRNPHLYSPKMVSIEITFTNNSDAEIKNISTGQQNLPLGMEMHISPEMESLATKASASVTIGIDFNDTTQPANFEICTNESKFNVSIGAPVGELLQPVSITDSDFVVQQNKLKGMTENMATCELNPNYKDEVVLRKRVCEVANLHKVEPIEANSTVQRYAAQTLSSRVLVLLSLRILDNNKVGVIVNCEKMVIGSMLLKEIKSALM